MKTAFHLLLVVFAFLGAAAPGGQASDVEISPPPASVRFVQPVARDPVPKPGCVPKDIPQLVPGYELMLTGRFAEAHASFQTALDAAEKDQQPDPVTRACLMNMIAFAELQQGRAAAAVQWFQRGLGLDPPSGAVRSLLTSNLAMAYFELGQTDSAEQTARAAMRLATQVFGAEHPETSFAQATLASVHMKRGEGARAEPVFRRILYQAERTWGTASYEASLAATNLAMAYLLQRQYSQAQPLLERALAGLRRNPIRAADEIPFTEATLAWSYAVRGRRREAQMWLDCALASAERDLGPEHPRFALVLERIANTLFLLKDHGAGRQMFERVITLLQTLHGRSSQPVLDALERYAGLLRDAKDKSGSRIVEDRRRTLMP